jgi:putative ABC transport system substrate-binding protein
MRRREFIAGIGATAALVSRSARAQQTRRLPSIAIVYSVGTVNEMAGTNALGVNMRAFEKALHDRGWIEGRTVAIERRSPEGDPRRAKSIMAEVVLLKPDLILLGGARWLHEAALAETKTIPIVAPFGEDPISAGLIASLARPGGNLTGVTRTAGPEFYSKALGLLLEASPSIKRPAFLAPSEAILAFSGTFRPSGIEIVSAQADTTAQIDGALASILREGADALLVPSGPAFLQKAEQIGKFAEVNKLPGIFGMRQSAEAGGLMSYGPSIIAVYRQMAGQVDRILRGARPQDIPTEQPTTFELIINLKAAKTLGIAMPPTLLASADEVIE